MTEGMTVGVVGLGAMGLGMALSTARAGFATRGFDLSPARLDLAQDGGITPVTTLEEVFAADRIVFSLPTAQDVARVIDKVRPVLQDRGRIVVIDTSTSEPDVSRAVAATLADMGHGFLDAPVSGGPSGAANGALTMMIGGTAADLDDARPVIDALSAKAIHVGDSGAGNVAKLVNNLLCAAHMVTTAEGLRLAEAAGVPAEAALEVLNAASGRSMMSEVHFPTWVMNEGFDSGFTMALMQKDVRLARKLAADTGTDLPLTTRAADLWATSPLAATDDFTRMGDFRPKGQDQ
ncbi:NAD(P)-dependent oxidoreductase [Falsirhodobacter halotolerans]|uniref:NAD(P)-dependent oxidoreductase n=1 Tax=Falsirhodobacter halotolerans TaxID=1146892 RepID=UPI001FD41C39|nr:NAD(P)-dependent oxidoreductase [Falsirhodobacter halotolerans]MCJ8140896.1 NAD(P)-dependent oxidoreductase [Falsirhodobacter halotolerans]